jgi:Flp pilus assembly protein TadD
MKTTRLFKKVMSKIIMGASIVLMGTSACDASQVDPIVQEARLKAAEGDLEAATALYHEAMKNDEKNAEIRHELATILVNAHVREPHADTELEVIEIIEKGTKAIVD